MKYRPLSIFLAEDNADDIEITKRAFAKCGIASRLIVARDGEEAIRLLAETVHAGTTDLAMLDIKLPRLNGFEVLAHIRADKSLAALPVIMLSASAHEEDIERSYRLGANTYVQKPVAFEAFVETLDTLCRYWFEIAKLPRAA